MHITSTDKLLYCLDARTGTVRWKTNLENFANVKLITSYDRTICIIADKIYSLAADSGRLNWINDIKSIVITDPVVSGQNLYLKTMDNRVYCLDAKTGLMLWDIRTPKGFSAFTINNEHLYLSSSDGTFYCLKILQ